MTILIECEICRSSAGEPHRENCPESDLGKRRRKESYTLIVNGYPVHLTAELDGGRWRGSWEGYGQSSSEGPVGGIEESRYPTADTALANALLDVLPVIRAMRGKSS